MNESVNQTVHLAGGLEAELVHTLEYPCPSPSNNDIREMHFGAYKKLRFAWRLMTKAATGYKPVTDPIKLAYLEVDRYSIGTGLDWDNAYGGLKPIFDCLVAPSSRNPDGQGLITDDSPKWMPIAPFVRQYHAKRKDSRTVIRIYKILESDPSA